jgi:D-sedoheptulose 7-phosphate isomerase
MLGAELGVGDYLDRCSEVFRTLDRGQVEGLAADLFSAWEKQKFVFVCGNGGSGSNASHLAADAGKNTLRREDFTNDAARRLKIWSLTDNTPNILAWGNDEGFDRIFVEQLKNVASTGDVLVAISGSGNSPNLLSAVEWANAHDLVTWGVTGYDGGKLRPLARRSLHVDLFDMGMVESVHLVVFHWILNDLYGRINRVGRYSDGMHSASRAVFEGN